jgi:pyruvate formate lyase activating enzyme
MGGGEPLGQSEFCKVFLREAKRRNLHTAIETCGYAEWSHLQSIIEHTDLVFIDIKHMNPLQHRKLTGKSNELILENIKRASRVIDGEEKEIIIRIPVIPTLNDSEDNIRATAEFIRGLEKIKKIELLTYHNMGQAKYLRTKWTKPYSLQALKPISFENIQVLKDIVESTGLVGEIGAYY